MDSARPERAPQRRLRRTVYGLAGLAVIPLITWGLSRLKPAAKTRRLRYGMKE